jgi:hypothetical protein
VHREDLAVELFREDLAARAGQLEPDQQRLDPADQEEEERGVAVQDPDALVVHRGEPGPESGGRGGPAEQAAAADGNVDGGHLRHHSRLVR